jgi:hypothetical protein
MMNRSTRRDRVDIHDFETNTMRPTRPAAFFALIGAAALAWPSLRFRAPAPVRLEPIPEIVVPTNVTRLVADNSTRPTLIDASFLNRRGPAIDVNSAPAEQLEILPRIGPSLAKRIVEERAKGPFRSVDDLRKRVKGIGAVTAASLKNYLVPPTIDSPRRTLQETPSSRAAQSDPSGRENPQINP